MKKSQNCRRKLKLDSYDAEYQANSENIYYMSTLFTWMDVHAQARMSRNAYSGGRGAYNLMRVGSSEHVEILT